MNSFMNFILLAIQKQRTKKCSKEKQIISYMHHFEILYLVSKIKDKSMHMCFPIQKYNQSRNE